MLDVDRFKTINDTFGHHAGDQILQELARILENHTRSADTVGRWGGEEFLLICPGTESSGAEVLAEKLRKTIEKHTFPVIRHCTCSFGVSASCKGERTEDLVIRADQAMYQAKELGRNRAVNHS
jgi:diguanylate cyclase (GGDEF)-like protein